MAGHVKMINVSLMWYHVKAYAFPLMEIKWQKSLFGLLSVITLELWGVDKWGIAEVTFAYLNIICQFSTGSLQPFCSSLYT